MKATLFMFVLLLAGCNSQPQQQTPVGSGIRVMRGADGKIVSVPDSSRRDSF